VDSLKKEFDKKALLNLVLEQFKLNRDGYHGPSHWARVRVHALEIGQMRGADLLVVNYSLFCTTAKGLARAQTLNTGSAQRNMLLH
jgi:hypothetical protein